MPAWEHLGEADNVVQLIRVDAARLIGMIVQAANTARMHKNCRQFALRLKLIGGLLEPLKISELKKKYLELREPLERLEDALRRSYILVNSSQDRSYLYLLGMGWNIVYQFRKAQNEIDRYLKLVPLKTCIFIPVVLEYLEMFGHLKNQAIWNCMRTLFCPCGTFSKIANEATGRHMSAAEACNDLMSYSLILSCCCYTCCVRRKLRKMLSIKGGWFGDFPLHLMCCCCSLVREYREIEIRGIGPEKTKTSSPHSRTWNHETA